MAAPGRNAGNGVGDKPKKRLFLLEEMRMTKQELRAPLETKFSRSYFYFFYKLSLFQNP
jgi:hypothetical protein